MSGHSATDGPACFNLEGELRDAIGGKHLEALREALAAIIRRFPEDLD
jgi:hypothetical protein